MFLKIWEGLRILVIKIWAFDTHAIPDNGKLWYCEWRRSRDSGFVGATVIGAIPFSGTFKAAWKQ